MDDAAAVEAYFEAWQANQPEWLDAVLAPDIHVEGPLGVIDGASQYKAALSRLFAITRRLEIRKRWVDGPDVGTWFDLHHTGDAKAIACVNWLRIEAGLVTQVKVAFDPRAILTLMNR
ncbi:nuclear transport factor 2 family protein [Caulobacter endophyticus]|uniref:Nuclear transport factor 2 family protein n=1 Tax=Caulobacter endophyticus TaxID=2172652 RepID=A0A2T9K9S1_9CAUL|nr:nuclear transport factor 2 family protein [Caulobacter endophyticus]PVM92718.1 nuclear transport factor 2 family protein [Caulobacter endophyticus]